MAIGADSGQASQAERAEGRDSAPEPTLYMEASTTETETKTKIKTKTDRKTRMLSKPTFRHRRTPICLLTLYIPTLIVPWVLIVVTSRSTTFLNQTGNAYVSSAAAVLAARLLSSINGVLAVPIISTLLAHAAVVYAMRRRHDQKLTVQQLFALADKGWTDIPLLFKARSNGKSSRFLWLAAILILLGVILQPLMSVLVSFETITVPSALDIPLGHGSSSASIIGYDPEPTDMPFLQPDTVLRDVLGRLTTFSDLEPQPNLWPSNAILKSLKSQPLMGQAFLAYSPGGFDAHNDGFFVSAVNSNTNTGVLREHALRLNSSIQCEQIARSSFPSPCPGDEPFRTQVTRPGLELSVCAPGNASQFPFTVSRNRQDIVEELFIDLHVSSDIKRDSLANNFTVHCTASTSRGYFELPNEQNKYAAGPLLDAWPSPQYISNSTNDYRGVAADYARPSVEDPETSALSGGYLPSSHSAGHPFYPADIEHSSTPGPLMVSAEVLFGNYSFVQFLADNITEMTPLQTYASVCEHGSIPFSQTGFFVATVGDYVPLRQCYDAAGNVRSAVNGSYLDPEDLDRYLTIILASHVGIFNSTDLAEYAFRISTFVANRAVLINTVSAVQPFGARPIYSSPGTVFQRPIINIASLVVITVLIALQLLGLGLLTRLIYSVPTWASVFDALRVAQIGKVLPIQLPSVGHTQPEQEEQLADIDGLIGIDGGHISEKENHGVVEDDRVAEEDTQTRNAILDSEWIIDRNQAHLALGGTGLITGEIAKQLAKAAKSLEPTPIVITSSLGQPRSKTNNHSSEGDRLLKYA
ncbi:hypothetical protein F4777DRAFT_273756 [Nemania sp. FL0916]|nr:hypothetical protein F4777DRAFT_273756 [Nemania sp. FL0916]